MFLRLSHFSAALHEPWEELFARFHARFASFFLRQEVRERSRRYLRALMNAAVWDEEAVRDELAQSVGQELGDRETGVFVLDESGVPKKGRKSVGVGRQYWAGASSSRGAAGCRKPQANRPRREA